MELDDLKNSWEAVSIQVAKQPNLTSNKIDQMTQVKYYSSLKKVTLPETMGTIICLMGAAYIVLNFYKLDKPFLQAIGIVSILLLLMLSVMSLLSIRHFTKMGNVNKPYAATLKLFAAQKIKFHKFQKINITLSYLLMVTIVILLSKFFGDKDLTDNKYFWLFSFSFGYLFLLFYSRWVLKYYNKSLREAEGLLKEIN